MVSLWLKNITACNIINGISYMLVTASVELEVTGIALLSMVSRDCICFALRLHILLAWTIIMKYVL